MSQDMSIHSQTFLGGYTHLFIGITVLFGVKRSAGNCIRVFQRNRINREYIYVHKYIFQIYAFIIRNWIMQHGT